MEQLRMRAQLMPQRRGKVEIGAAVSESGQNPA